MASDSNAKIRPKFNDIAEDLVIDLQPDDVGFVLGKRGIVKKKIQRLSHASLNLDGEALTLKISGTKTARWKAFCYCSLIIAQRVEDPVLDLDYDWPPVTFLKVPETCLARLIGKGGSTLRNLELEFDCLLLFVHPFKNGKPIYQSKHILASFGPRKGRCNAVVSLMSSICIYVDGYMNNRGSKLSLNDGFKHILKEEAQANDTEYGYDDGAENGERFWEMQVTKLVGDDIPYATGRQGAAKKKIAISSGAIFEIFGNKAVIIGSTAERKRAAQYLRWLLQQRNGISHVNRPEDHVDCTIVPIQESYTGYVCGRRGVNLRDIESKTDTFIFLQRYHDRDRKPNNGKEYVLVFSYNKLNRLEARDLLYDLVREKERADARSSRYSQPSFKRRRHNEGERGEYGNNRNRRQQQYNRRF